MLRKFSSRLRRRFIDGPRGYGHPVPAAAFDREYRAGHWQLLESTDEQVRYETLVKLVREHTNRPGLLDAGCGSGRLALSFKPEELAFYHGVDLSGEAILQARERLPNNATLYCADLETWQPTHSYDAIVVNEVIGYFRDPAATLERLAKSLGPDCPLIVSLYRWGNAPAIWRRLNARFSSVQSLAATNEKGDKVWDIRVLTAPTLR